MKCPFCVADNPPHANFCMNCGSPLDLKACKECGGINRKTVSNCQMCGAAFDETVPAEIVAPPPPTSPSNAQEAEALAKETQTFKQLFAELEHDVNTQLLPVGAIKTSASPSLAQQLSPPAAPVVGTPTVVEPPSYLREILAERAAKKNYPIAGRQQLMIIAVFLVAVVLYGYYNAFGRQKSQALPKPQTSSKITSDAVEAKATPAEELPATKPAAPPVSEPVLASASIAPILAAVPCSALVASVHDQALQVQGFLPERFGIARLKDTLSKVPGVKALSTDIRQVGDDKCAVLKSFASYWTRNRQAGGAASIHTKAADGDLTEDDPLILALTTPAYNSYVNVDYYLVDGNVVHLLPGPKGKDNQAPPNYAATIGSDGDWVIAKPFGTELVVLLVTPAPLFDAIRPQFEIASDYLRAVDDRLRQMAAKYGSERIAVDLIQITTKPRKR